MPTPAKMLLMRTIARLKAARAKECTCCNRRKLNLSSS
jgi:hypothetical protein